MPYYVPGNDRTKAEELVKTHICKECGRSLYAYIGREGKVYIACPTPGHEGIEKEYQPTRFAKDGLDSLNQKGREEKMTQDLGEERTKALVTAGVPLSGVLSKPQAVAILRTVWPKAPDMEVFKASVLCADYGLHPLMRHVYLIMYKKYDKDHKAIGETWSTVLGIGATRLIMSRMGTFSYIDDTPRIMSDEEQTKIFNKIDQDNIVAITKLRTKDGMEAPGYGRYPKSGKEPMGADKGNTRENMAFIRSERNAFSRLFPDKLPGNVEIVDETYLRGTDNVIEEVVEGEKPETPLAKAKPSKAQETAPPTGGKTEEVLQYVADQMKFKNIATARQWLEKSMKIDTGRIDSEPEVVLKEVSDLQGWNL